MAWLSGFNNRLKLTIPDTNVDGNLTDFPVLVHISAAAGIGDVDASAVFDELASDVNRKKIAITTSDGETQCYVEIEKWDDVNEQAWLWVKVPSILATGGATLYFYYDSSKSDNTAYVGDTGDTPAQNVWDANFVAVYHMAQDPNGDAAGAIKDSTDNEYHGTPSGSMTTADLVDGLIGKAIEFDGSNDRIDTTCPGVGGANDRTVEVIFSQGSHSIGAGIVFWGWTSLTEGTKWNVTLDATYGTLRTENQGGNVVGSGSSLKNSAWHSVASVFSGTNVDEALHYVDGGLNSEASHLSYAVNTGTNYPVTISAQYQIGSTWAYMPGKIGEVRISDIARPAAWIKATYYSNWDGLVEFGAEEVYVTFAFSNPIPTDLSTVYGTSHTLYLTTTVIGSESSYSYDATFYNAHNDSLIDTASGVQSGQPAGVVMSTISGGTNYSWYCYVTSSGYNNTSSTYSFLNMFLCEGVTSVNNVSTSGVPVRLYLRETGEYIGGTTSAGVSGTFEIETSHNAYHYIVGLYDSDDTNAIVYDWIKPE